ncbi:hypothetical protein LSAT2_010709, partial [Lamellibrachia satsuma]
MFSSIILTIAATRSSIHRWAVAAVSMLWSAAVVAEPVARSGLHGRAGTTRTPELFLTRMTPATDLLTRITTRVITVAPVRPVTPFAVSL